MSSIVDFQLEIVMPGKYRKIKSKHFWQSENSTFIVETFTFHPGLSAKAKIMEAVPILSISGCGQGEGSPLNRRPGGSGHSIQENGEFLFGPDNLLCGLRCLPDDGQDGSLCRVEDRFVGFLGRQGKS
jgi:hypothetical protein